MRRAAEGERCREELADRGSVGLCKQVAAHGDAVAFERKRARRVAPVPAPVAPVEDERVVPAAASERESAAAGHAQPAQEEQSAPEHSAPGRLVHGYVLSLLVHGCGGGGTRAVETLPTRSGRAGSAP